MTVSLLTNDERVLYTQIKKKKEISKDELIQKYGRRMDVDEILRDLELKYLIFTKE